MKIKEQRKFVNENKDIYIPTLYKERMFSKKIEKKREIMTSLYTSSKNDGYSKRNYMREGKKEVQYDKYGCL